MYEARSTLCVSTYMSTVEGRTSPFLNGRTVYDCDKREALFSGALCGRDGGWVIDSRDRGFVWGSSLRECDMRPDCDCEGDKRRVLLGMAFFEQCWQYRCFGWYLMYYSGSHNTL